jgi:hypothetical protein
MVASTDLIVYRAPKDEVHLCLLLLYVANLADPIETWYMLMVLVAAGGIPSWTTFLREEDSKKSKEDH